MGKKFACRYRELNLGPAGHQWELARLRMLRKKALRKALMQALRIFVSLSQKALPATSSTKLQEV
jgi:hypothetical protein